MSFGFSISAGDWFYNYYRRGAFSIFIATYQRILQLHKKMVQLLETIIHTFIRLLVVLLWCTSVTDHCVGQPLSQFALTSHITSDPHSCRYKDQVHGLDDQGFDSR